MNPRFKFENLITWKEAMNLGEDINSITKEFPSDELYNLSSQIRRAADSIAMNISEGSIEQSKPEFRKFMGYAIRSLAEVITCLNKAKNREYISAITFSKFYDSSLIL